MCYEKNFTVNNGIRTWSRVTGYCCITGLWYLKTVMEERRVIWKFVTTFKHYQIS